MMTESLGQQTYSTILGGVVLLWNMGSYPVVLDIYSPRIGADGENVGYCLVMLERPYHRPHHRRGRTRLYRLTEFIGRWSMVDVFVVAILVADPDGQTVCPGFAALAFAGVVILTHALCHEFDPVCNGIMNQPRISLSNKEQRVNKIVPNNHAKIKN